LNKKICVKCKKEKFTEEFYKRKDSPNGYRNDCKECLERRTIKNHFKNREERLKQQKKWYEKNKEYKLKKDREYNKENKEKRREYDKIRNQTKERKEYNKQYCIKKGLITGTGQSKEEKIIEDWLKKKGFRYEKEKTFESCRNKQGNLLNFDFWIPYKNLIVEYDGIYHFLPIFGEEELRKRKEYDQVKNQFCKINNIDLIRINYKQNLLKELRITI